MSQQNSYIFGSDVSKSDLQSQLSAFPLPQSDLAEAVALPNSKSPGFSHVFRNKVSPDSLIKSLHPSLVTVYDYFKFTVESFPDRQFLGYRKFDSTTKKYEDKYSWVSYKEADNISTSFGSGLLSSLSKSLSNQGVKFEKDSNLVVTIFSLNRPEWLLSDLACMTYDITTTALYDSLSSEHSAYILKLTESPIIVCSKDKISFILGLKDKHPVDLRHLKVLVSMDELPKNDLLVHTAKGLAIDLYDFNQILKLGESSKFPENPAKSSTDTYTISFTSGTSGSFPKGVVLSHENGTSAITMNIQQLSRDDFITTYSFLPLAHIYERMSTLAAMSIGYRIGFPSGDSSTMFSDLKVLKPNYFAAVPRVFNKIEILLKSLTINSKSEITRSTTSHIIEEKMALQSRRDGDMGKHEVYDKILINKLRHELGFDNIIHLFSASAPISPNTIKFLKACLNVGLCQGYGMTESFGTISLSSPYEAVPGTSGCICPTTELRLRDLPDMGYTSDDKGGPRGEILLRGGQMFPRYYKNPKQTSEDIDQEGWFHSGDIARLDPKGRIIIVDRVKNFFKLSQGEFVTPEKIEHAYLASSHLVNQLFVHGDPIQTFLVAIVGANPDHIDHFFTEICGLNLSDIDTVAKQEILFKNEKIRRLFFKELHHSIKAKDLKGFEKIHNIHIAFEPLRISNDVLTPTLKLKRPIAARLFRGNIDEMYAEGSLLKSNKL